MLPRFLWRSLKTADQKLGWPACTSQANNMGNERSEPKTNLEILKEIRNLAILLLNFSPHVHAQKNPPDNSHRVALSEGAFKWTQFTRYDQTTIRISGTHDVRLERLEDCG